MSLQVTGKINMKNSICIKCGESIYIKARSDYLRCNRCGATYSSVGFNICDQHIEYEYDFDGFECLYDDYTNGPCSKLCPSMRMYCREHSSQKFQSMASNSVDYAEKKLEEAKDVLENIKESRRLWLIQEVSGLDEDGAFQADEIDEDPEVDDLGRTEGK